MIANKLNKVSLQAEQLIGLEDTDVKIDEQEIEAHYRYMAKDSINVYDNVIRHSEQHESINDTYVLEKDDSNVTPDSSNIFNSDYSNVNTPNARHIMEDQTFANVVRYLKKAQSEKPCLYEIPFDTSDPANRFAPEREETTTLDNESRSKLNKDYVKPYDYTKQNSLYEIFKGPSLEYLYQLERAKRS
ncbi:hypothetical protein Tco_0318512 [Tanacetum coccineum]